MQMNGVRPIELLASSSRSAGTATGDSIVTYEFPASSQHNAFKGHTKRGRVFFSVSASAAGRSAYGVVEAKVPGTSGAQAYHWVVIFTTDIISDTTGAVTGYITDHISTTIRGKVVTAVGAVTSELHIEISG